MSDFSRHHIPPYLPDLIGVNKVAEAAFEQEGEDLVLHYRPAILLRGDRTDGLTSDQAWHQVRAALVEARDGPTRYGPFELVPVEGETLPASLKLAIRAVWPSWRRHCGRWLADWMNEHREVVDRAEQAYEREQGGEGA
jgi:hypothetical protein